MLMTMSQLRVVDFTWLTPKISEIKLKLFDAEVGNVSNLSESYGCNFVQSFGGMDRCPGPQFVQS